MRNLFEGLNTTPEKSTEEKLTERLSKTNIAIEEALDTMLEKYGEKAKELDEYLLLAGELSDNENLLIEIENT